jgi:cobalamin biosynthesis Mg chelatase CobN
MLALSTIALFALSCFPAFAQAQTSAEVEYQDAPPTVPGHTGGSAKDNEPSATKANAGGGSGGDSNSPGGGSAKGGSSDKTGNAAHDGGRGDQQGSQGNRANEGSDGAQQGALSATTSEEDDDGSSPLVPILIAIAVLAAISIGVVVMRQRRGQDASPGSPASPEAG